MSRSNPTDNSPNPATRWFEWNGAEGHFRYYDKEKKERVDLSPDFTFILLDRLVSVRGWHEPSESGITSNEVRDTREEPLVVRAFKGGKIAAGLYPEIRDKIAAAGGHFTLTLYCAFKGAAGLALGAVQLKGAALSAWFEFEKANRKTVYEQAIRVKGSRKDKKGKVEFHVPLFSLNPVSEATNKQAVALDVELQAYLKDYFARTRGPMSVAEQLQPDAQETYEEEPPEESAEEPATVQPGAAEDDDVPF